jgi:tetratricopeptide (TPR) repeat protein
MSPNKLNELFRSAVSHHDAGRFAEAEKLYAQVCAAAPKSFDAWHVFGWLALQHGRPADAAKRLERAAKLNPKSGLCQLRLAHALKKTGRLSEARAAADRAAQLEPANADAHFCAGDLAAATDGFAAAVPHFRRVTELQPNAADGWANLGVALVQSGGGAEALNCFERSLTLDATNAQALLGRALALQETGRVTEAVAAYDAVLERQPDHHAARSARLLTLHYTDGRSRELLFEDHRAFGAAVGSSTTDVVFPNSAEPERKLRVAFLSPDLRAHSVAYFLQPLLEHLDPAGFEILLYHDHARVDATSEQLRRLAGLWRNFAGQSADVVEATIRADAPDILVDLAGHTGFNRLPLFARRLAPVQVTYLGYPNTTGLSQMDFRFVDGVTDPEGVADAFATERLIRFAPTAWAYAPPADAPRPIRDAEPRAITFGCFNNYAKVNDATLAVWAAVLARVPGSRLLLKSQGLEAPVARRRIQEYFAERGIDVSRIDLVGRLPGIGAHLAMYGRVDVALDTFPYNGTTTTCEALWMGVPVVSLVGEAHMSRVGFSLLSAVGHSEWAVTSVADYVNVAAELAQTAATNPERREQLRHEMARSALLDHEQQAARFGSALRDCWRNECLRRRASVG